MFTVPGKKKLLKQKFISDENFKWEDYEEYIEGYKEMVLSVAEQELVEWNEMIKLRTKTLKELYAEKMAEDFVNVKELKEIDAMLSHTPKMFKEYLDIKKNFEEDQLKSGKGQHHEGDY